MSTSKHVGPEGHVLETPGMAHSDMLAQPATNEQTRVSARQRIGRFALAAALALGSVVGITATENALVPSRAEAVESTGGYPDAGAVDCSATFGRYSWCEGNPAHDLSARGYGYRNCTDWAAFREQQLTGVVLPKTLGNANTWAAKAPSQYVRTALPESGDIAQSSEGSFGHVGVVERVDRKASGQITDIVVSEYNNAGTGAYSILPYTPDAAGIFWRNAAHTERWDTFIDVNGVGTGAADDSAPASDPRADGTFVRSEETGAEYRMVGGAPVRLTDPGAIAGSDAYVSEHQSAIDALAAYPADGSFINIAEAGGNGVYRFAGGAPIRLYNWGAVPGCCGDVVSVNFGSLATLDHMRAQPADGTVVSIVEAGGSGLYRFVGGAPVRLYNWGAIPDCCGTVVGINEQSLATLDHMNDRPADGAVITIAEAGGSGVYRFVGGAPIRQYNWGALPGCCNAVAVNFASLATLDHMNAVPRDGSFITIEEAGGNGVYEFAGGAPMRLYNWGNIPGCCSDVIDVNFVSLATFDHMNTMPANGTFLASVETGRVYRMAGGAPLPLYDWGDIPDFRNAVFVNQQTIDSLDHMQAVPADGTVLCDRETGQDWQITGGERIAAPVQPGAVIVDDQTVGRFPVARE